MNQIIRKRSGMKFICELPDNPCLFDGKPHIWRLHPSIETKGAVAKCSMCGFETPPLTLDTPEAA